MGISKMTSLGCWYDIEDIKTDLYNHIILRNVDNEYKEVYYEIILTFKNNDSVTKYFFKKKEWCYPCVNQACKCSCLVDGRERLLHIINPPPHDNLEELGSCTIEEYARNDNKGYIKFLKQDKAFNQFNTKLVWVWCHNRVKMGEFRDGARMLDVYNPLRLSTTPSPLKKAIEMYIKEGGKT